MADGGRWKPYVQRQGQLLPAFVSDALDPSGRELAETRRMHRLLRLP